MGLRFKWRVSGVKPILQSTVPTGVATLHEFTLHDGHRADNDFSYSSEALRFGYNPFIISEVIRT